MTEKQPEFFNVRFGVRLLTASCDHEYATRVDVSLTLVVRHVIFSTHAPLAFLTATSVQGGAHGNVHSSPHAPSHGNVRSSPHAPSHGNVRSSWHLCTCALTQAQAHNSQAHMEYTRIRTWTRIAEACVFEIMGLSDYRATDSAQGQRAPPRQPHCPMSTRESCTALSCTRSCTLTRTHARTHTLTALPHSRLEVDFAATTGVYVFSPVPHGES
jgi:hypothetical protein